MKALAKPPVGGELTIDESDREMSRFVMDRIDQCFQIPDDFVYEVMVNGIKKYKTIHGESVYAKVTFASASLHRLLDMKMIARVGEETMCKEAAMIMHCFYCRQWFGFNTRSQLVT